MGVGPRLLRWSGRSTAAPSPGSDVDLLCDGEGVIDLDTQVTDGALDPRVAEQELHRAQIAGTAVDQRRLRPAQRVRAEERRVEPRKLDPVADEPGVLARG